MALKISNAVMAVVLVFSAAVQVNDPDPAPWVVAYGMSAVLCVVWALGHLTARVALANVFALAVLMAMTGLQPSGEAAMSWGPTWGPLGEEILREQLGLALAAGWLVVLGMTQARVEAGVARGAVASPAQRTS